MQIFNDVRIYIYDSSSKNRNVRCCIKNSILKYVLLHHRQISEAQTFHKHMLLVYFSVFHTKENLTKYNDNKIFKILYNNI